MADISRVALFDKLHAVAYKAIEGATVFCKLRGNPYVELSHWLQQILQVQASDMQLIVRAFDLDPAAVARDITAALDRLPRGATAVSDIAAHVEDATERAWVWASLKFGATKIRTAHLVIAILKSRDLRNAFFALSREFEKINADTLIDDFARILPQSSEGTADSERTTTTGEATDPAQSPLGKQQALQRFTVDLTAQARRGEIDPVVGRDEEIRQIIDILMRRRQNNPILAGEAGVGKTAIVEGFARRIAAGDVPPPL